jgi:hypothetical protein
VSTFDIHLSIGVSIVARREGGGDEIEVVAEVVSPLVCGCLQYERNRDVKRERNRYMGSEQLGIIK